jgi:hypothetical protein
MSSMILMQCPVTHDTVSTGLIADPATYRLLRSKKSGVYCSSCNGMHDWWDTRTWLARMATSYQCVPERKDARRTVPAI